MRRFTFFLSVLFVISFVSRSGAIDRGARIIDTTRITFTDLDNGDAAGGSLWGETALASPDEKWAVLAGLSYTKYSMDNWNHPEYYYGAIGIKYYMTVLTSLSLVGSYSEYDFQSYDNTDIIGATTTLKHRLLDADQPVSPYLQGSVTYQSIDQPADAISGDGYTEVVYNLGAGCEFMMSDTLSIVFEGFYFDGEDTGDGPQPPDGWMASLGMTYYWAYRDY